MLWSANRCITDLASRSMARGSLAAGRVWTLRLHAHGIFAEALTNRELMMPLFLEDPEARVERAEDEEMEARVIAVLRTSGYAPLNRVGCRVSEGVVELFGSVPTFYFKQMAQAFARRVGDVKEIRNEVLVD